MSKELLLPVELAIGAATADITPTGPVAVMGQWELRISTTVETPLTANVLVLESRQSDKSLDTAVMVSCDLCLLPGRVLEAVRAEVHKRLPDLDTKKIFLNATHSHTTPALNSNVCLYAIPTEGVLQVDDYQALLVRQIVGAIVRAWESRVPGSVTWGLGHAVVACGRRAVYADGSAVMYGPTNVPEFRGVEGYEDHDVGTLFFWNEAGKLVCIVVNVSCPAQEVESRTAVNADYWHPVRESLRERYGPEVCIVGWIGAAGNQSPHLRYRQAADDRMTQLRGLTRLQEIARRIDNAVDETYEAVKNDRHADAPLIHKVETIHLPMRFVTEAEYIEAKAAYEQLTDQIAKDPKAADLVYCQMKWQEGTVERFESQKTNPKPTYEMELHVLRIGDAAVCTSAVELFTEYGIQIKARSPAIQTFVIELTGDGTYLPTENAVRAGGYSAIAQNNPVGPEGGQVLVDRTVELIHSLWAESN
jgi:hypothetical protein